MLTSWAAPACNNPLFAEIVPPDMRNLVYAFDRSFEGECTNGRTDGVFV